MIEPTETGWNDAGGLAWRLAESAVESLEAVRRGVEKGRTAGDAAKRPGLDGARIRGGWVDEAGVVVVPDWFGPGQPIYLPRWLLPLIEEEAGGEELATELLRRIRTGTERKNDG